MADLQIVPAPDETLTPVNDWVVLMPMDGSGSEGGIALPEGYADDAHGNDGDHVRERNQLCQAAVVAVGPGFKYSGSLRVPLDVVVGDRVMYNRADGRLLRREEPMIVAVRHHCIYMVVEGGARQVLGGLVTA